MPARPKSAESFAGSSDLRRPELPERRRLVGMWARSCVPFRAFQSRAGFRSGRGFTAVGTSGCDVPAGVRAGGTDSPRPAPVRSGRVPLNAAQTAPRALPAAREELSGQHLNRFVVE